MEKMKLLVFVCALSLLGKSLVHDLLYNKGKSLYLRIFNFFRTYRDIRMLMPISDSFTSEKDINLKRIGNVFFIIFLVSFIILIILIVFRLNQE
jgi:type IV secretory pathway VirB6-like protein